MAADVDIAIFKGAYLLGKIDFPTKNVDYPQDEGCAQGQGLIISGSRSEQYGSDKEIEARERCTACTKVKSKVL